VTKLPLRRALSENRWLVLPLSAVLLANAAAYLFVVRPLALSSRGAAARADAAARAVSLAERDLAVAQSLVSNKAHADEELTVFYRKVLPATQAQAVRMTYARLPGLARQADVEYARRRQELSVDEDSKLGVLTIRMELRGEYESLREFIYRLETAPEFVIIDNVTLTEPDAYQPLTLLITLSTYFRSTGGDGV
jgi:hypothetical protein